MSQEQATKNYFNCIDANNDDCEELAFSASPSTEFQALLVKSNAATRDEGTSRSQTGDVPPFRYANTIAGTDNVSIDPFAGTATPGQNLVFEANGITFATQQPNNSGESVSTVDSGGTEREGSNNSGQTQSIIDDQRAKKRTVIDGGNKAYPFINPLASTNIEGIEPIDPHADLDNGAEGTLYDPTLLEDEGIVYLRQYLSFDDEETGAVWRFQYAPQISWTRSATFQEDKSWGSNVQPAHYNNTSGKRISIQGAILEGMTIGKTVTGAVTALEVLMSVANPDNELQVAPYAYRFIIGGRTLTEPVSGKHSPFVIEQLSVKEEMYDTQGQMISVKIDLTLREIPFYQINDGRKLLLITQDRADLITLKCEEITRNIIEANTQIESRRVINEQTLASANAEFENEGEDKDALAAKFLTKEGGKPLTDLRSNCSADSQAYTNLVKLFRQYEEGDNGRPCNTGKDTSGFKTIESQFARNNGIYEILKGRKLTGQSDWRPLKVFDENGNYVKSYPEALKELGLDPEETRPAPPLNVINVDEKNISVRGVNGKSGRQNFKAYVPKGNDYLKSCPHIYCVSEKDQNNTSDENIDKALSIVEYFANTGQKGLDELQNFSGLDATSENVNALTQLMKTIMGGANPGDVRNILKIVNSDGIADFIWERTAVGFVQNLFQEDGGSITELSVISPIMWLCGSASSIRPAPFIYNDGNFAGLEDNGGLLKNSSKYTYSYFQSRAAEIQNKSGWFERFDNFLVDVEKNDNPVDNLVGAQICNCASYAVKALQQKFNTFERDRDQNCSKAAAAAQASGAYDGYALRLNKALELFVKNHVGGSIANNLNTFCERTEDAAVKRNGNKSCTTSGGYELSSCLGASCIAQNIILIDQLLKDIGGLKDNPLKCKNAYSGVIANQNG